MSSVVQISILGKVYGNVNADEVIGNRITLKKMYSSDGEVLPFVSARAIKYSIRQALRDRGFPIDTLVHERVTGMLPISDAGRPDEYVDNDLFGFMRTEGNRTYRRQAPIGISYFKALRDTPIKSEFAARFPRDYAEGLNPGPFEVEVADFIGRLNVIIYDYVGDFEKATNLPDTIPKEKRKGIDRAERRRRLQAFLEILLTPSYVLPRRTNSLNIPEYYVALVCLSRAGPLPIYQYLNYVNTAGRIQVDNNQLDLMVSRDDLKRKVKDNLASFYQIDYVNTFVAEEGSEIIKVIAKTSIKEAIDLILDFLIPPKAWGTRLGLRSNL